MKKVKAVERAQDKLVAAAVLSTQQIMKAAAERAAEAIVDGRSYREPALDGLESSVERFYRSILDSAVFHAEEAKPPSETKRLAAKPRRNRTLERIFRDRKYWKRVMTQSQETARSLREAYLKKLKKKFVEISAAVAEGRVAPEEVKKKMVTAWEVTRSRAETTFRTETTSTFAEAQVKFYEGEPDIIGMLFDSVRDSRRTTICQSRHGLVYRPGTDLLTKNTPALHWNCRSHLIPLANTAENRRLLEDPDRDPSKRRVVPLPPEWRK